MFQFLRQRRRRRAVLALSAGCFVLAAPGWAFAGAVDQATAPVVDAAAQTGTTVPPAVDAVEETIESVLDPVDDATTPVGDAVGDALGGVTKPVRDPVDKVRDDVTGSVPDGKVGIPDPVDDPPTGGADRATTPVGVPDPANGHSAPAGPGRANSRVRDARAGRAPLVPSAREPSSTALRSAAVVRRQPVERTASSSGSSAEQVARAVADASRAFRFPLLLAGALLLFLAVQGRIDSRDPKLAQRSDDDELMFA